jgi:hypothetical protein
MAVGMLMAGNNQQNVNKSCEDTVQGYYAVVDVERKLESDWIWHDYKSFFIFAKTENECYFKLRQLGSSTKSEFRADGTCREYTRSEGPPINDVDPKPLLKEILK